MYCYLLKKVKFKLLDGFLEETHSGSIAHEGLLLPPLTVMSDPPPECLICVKSSLRLNSSKRKKKKGDMGVVVVWMVKRKTAESELCYIVKLKGVRRSFTWLSILTTYGTIRYYANVIYLMHSRICR